MRLSTRARYGTRATVELASAYPGKAVSVRQMAADQRVSVKYLEHIMADLKAAGLAEAVRGAHVRILAHAGPGEKRTTLKDLVERSKRKHPASNPGQSG